PSEAGIPVILFPPTDPDWCAKEFVSIKGNDLRKKDETFLSSDIRGGVSYGVTVEI
ncbi:hypothetical protein IRJ41_014754, partial [Triplophysa rosa]